LHLGETSQTQKKNTARLHFPEIPGEANSQRRMGVPRGRGRGDAELMFTEQRVTVLEDERIHLVNVTELYT
jgi:hypothetical protein